METNMYENNYIKRKQYWLYKLSALIKILSLAKSIFIWKLKSSIRSNSITRQK